jgi:hypothetical protein
MGQKGWSPPGRRRPSTENAKRGRGAEKQPRQIRRENL